MLIDYESDIHANEIIQTKVMTELRILFKKDRSEVIKIANLRYGLNYTCLEGIIKKTGVLYKVSENGHYRFRFKNAEKNHDQISFNNSWISPQGVTYPTFLYGHRHRSETIQEEGHIPSNISNTDGWLCDNGWLKITEGRIHIFAPLTDDQVKVIKECIMLFNVKFIVHDTNFTKENIINIEKYFHEYNKEYYGIRADVSDIPKIRFGFRDGD